MISGHRSSRRRLLQSVDSGTSDGAATVETAGTGEAVSQEAADSFEIFEEEVGFNSEEQLASDDTFSIIQTGDSIARPVGDDGSFDGGGDGTTGDAEFAGDDGKFLDQAYLDQGYGGNLESFLDRLQYDEFGDLESTVQIRESDAAQHEHGGGVGLWKLRGSNRRL